LFSFANNDLDVLGNAHMTNYFTNNEDIGQLELALKAYGQTERNLKEPNPDLFWNRATIYEYLERYGEAIQDYNTAHMIDPTLSGDQQAGKIIDFVVKTSTVVQSRSNGSSKKHLEMVRSIPTSIDGYLKFPSTKGEDKSLTNYAVKAIGDLEGGQNRGAILTCRVLMHLDRPQAVPNSVLVVDSKNVTAVVSFYGTNNQLKEKVQTGDLCYIRDP
jgi:tetratricopeptide (TPR) repeat protein